MNIKKYKNLKKIGNVTTPFNGQTKDEAVHPGLDIANKTGTPIPALANGTVVAEGPVDNGMGNVVTLKDDQGNTHTYSHLSQFSVKPGTRVKKGQTIAKMGKSGNSYSPSGGDPSHLDVRISDAYGRWIDPMLYF